MRQQVYGRSGVSWACPGVGNAHFYHASKLEVVNDSMDAVFQQVLTEIDQKS